MELARRISEANVSNPLGIHTESKRKPEASHRFGFLHKGDRANSDRWSVRDKIGDGCQQLVGEDKE